MENEKRTTKSALGEQLSENVGVTTRKRSADLTTSLSTFPRLTSVGEPQLRIKREDV